MINLNSNKKSIFQTKSKYIRKIFIFIIFEYFLHLEKQESFPIPVPLLHNEIFHLLHWSFHPTKSMKLIFFLDYNDRFKTQLKEVCSIIFIMINADKIKLTLTIQYFLLSYLKGVK